MFYEKMMMGVQDFSMFRTIIEQDESGFYVAECFALKACYAQGKTFEETIENIKDVDQNSNRLTPTNRKAIPTIKNTSRPAHVGARLSDSIAHSRLFSQ
jgi:predicted RNase H-like HicB family nuclease